MRVSAALLIVIAICIGGFPTMLQYRSAHELSNTSDQSARAVAGLAVSASGRRNRSGQGIQRTACHIGAADSRRKRKTRSPRCRGSSRSSESGSNESDSASAKDTEYQSLLDSGSGVMGTIRIPKNFCENCRSTMARRSRHSRPVRGICMAVVCRWAARTLMP